MLRAGLFLLGVACALILGLMFASHNGWIIFGPCGPDLLGYLLLGGAFLAVVSGVLSLVIGLAVSGIRKVRGSAAG